jgi:hypothetical protein
MTRRPSPPAADLAEQIQVLLHGHPTPLVIETVTETLACIAASVAQNRKHAEQILREIRSEAQERVTADWSGLRSRRMEISEGCQ